MLGLIHGSGSPPESRGWPHSVLWRLGGFFFLLLLEGAGCLANPSSASGVSSSNNNNNHPSVNIYMSVEEVKKLLGKKACKLFICVCVLMPVYWTLVRSSCCVLSLMPKFVVCRSDCNGLHVLHTVLL